MSVLDYKDNASPAVISMWCVHMLDVTSDRRIQRRQRVLKKALIVFNHGHTTIGCQVLDLSDLGGKLMPVDVVSCPREFTLRLPTGDSHLCEVKWRKGTVLGVQFVGLEEPVKAQSPANALFSGAKATRSVLALFRATPKAFCTVSAVSLAETPRSPERLR